MVCIMGVETEYAVTDPKGPSVRRLAQDLLGLAQKHLVHLPHKQSGIFLTSGARFYIDNGWHPEWCTAECTNPTDVVLQIRAGEKHLVRLLRKQSKTALLLRSNVNYFPEPVTWGCHESHAHTCNADMIAKVMIPHLVTRIIYTGAGGLDPLHPGISFVISPRSILRSDSIHHQRDEPLAGDKLHRSHIILGESLCLDHPLWLRVATTSLLTILTDAGLFPVRHLSHLEDPTEAIRIVSRDPSLTAQIKLVEGGHLTALTIQYRYLELVEHHLDDPIMPEWATIACRRWRDTLDRLALGTEHAMGICDWALKQTLFTRQIDRQWYDWSQIERINASCRFDASAKRIKCSSTRSDMRDVDSTENDDRRNESFDFCELSQNERDAFLDLRARLCEIDMRFGQLPRGICSSLGVNTIDGVSSVTDYGIRNAMTWAPTDTRAAIRGHNIRVLSRSKERYVADWDGIFDLQQVRELDLSNPEATDAEWKSRARPSQRISQRDNDVDQLFDDVSLVYNRGNYRQLKSMLRNAFREYGEDTWIATRLLPYQAWAESRTGSIAKARRALKKLKDRCNDSDICANFLSIHRFQGLRPDGPSIMKWIKRCDQAVCSGWDDATLVNYLGHKGYALGRFGRLDEAIDILRRSVSIPLIYPNQQRLTARNRCDLADCLRIVGRKDEARRELDEAKVIFQVNGYVGELADHWLVVSAKMMGSADLKIQSFRMAARVQNRMGNPIGMVRTTLLIARTAGRELYSDVHLKYARKKMQSIVDLRHCAMLNRILDNWDQWLDDPDKKVCGDEYWLL